MHGALGSAVVHGRRGACDPSQTAMEPMVVEADANLRVARLIDANLDRAREGLRVIETGAALVWIGTISSCR